MPIFVMEVTGQEGWPFEDMAIAAVRADNLDEANVSLTPVVRAKCHELFMARKPRWDETAPMITREATPSEIAEFERRCPSVHTRNTVVFLINI